MAHLIIEKAVYKTKRWQKCRAAYYALRMSTDGAMCEICGQQPGVIVHHVVELTLDNYQEPSVVYGHDNFQLVCWACHERTKSGNGIPIRADIRFDDQGNAIPTGKIAR